MRLRQLLVGGQFALTVWVLVVGGLMVRTLVNLESIDLGFEAERLTVVALDHTSLGEPVEEQVAQLQRLIAEVEAAPGIVGATHLLSGPLPGTASHQSIVFLEGQATEEALGANPYMFLQVVEPDVFEVLGVTMTRGRGTRASDDARVTPVVVVNETAARTLWPGEDAVGKRVRAPIDPYVDTWWTVVGVVADTRYDAFPEPRPSLYFPIGQFDRFLPSYLIVRTDDTRPPVMQIVREALVEDPAMRAKGATTVRSTLDEPLARPRFAALMLTLLAGVTLVLAAAGIYGVMAFLVRSRQRELSVRLVCGATPAKVGEIVVRQALLLALAGGGIGAAGAVASGALFEALLYGVVPTDVMSVSVAFGVALGCALVACGIPAVRAGRVDPAEALRLD